MSAKQSGKSHALMWMCAPFIVLFLYIATWPPIVILTGKNGLIIGGGPTGIRYRGITSPRGIEVIYRPLSFLRYYRGGQNPIAHYWDWWARTLPISN